MVKPISENLLSNQICVVHPLSLQNVSSSDLACYKDWVAVGAEGVDLEQVGTELGGISRYFYARDLSKVALSHRQLFLDESARYSTCNSGLIWWSHALSYRSPLSHSLFEHYCVLQLLAHWQSNLPHGRLIVSGDVVFLRVAARLGYTVHMPRFLPIKSALRHRVGQLVSVACFFVKLLVVYAIKWSVWIRSGVVMRRKVSQCRSGTVVLSWVDAASIQNDIVKDGYLKQLYPLLESDKIPHLVMGIGMQSCGDVRALGRSKNGIPLSAFLGVGVVCRMVFKTLRLVFWSLNRPKQVSDTVAVLHDVISKRLVFSSLQPLLHYELVRRMHVRICPGVVVYPFENQPFEKMLILALRPHGTRLIGLQHASIPLHYVNFGLGQGDVEAMPLPDQVLANSEIWQKRLTDTMPGLPVSVGGAVRGAPFSVAASMCSKPSSVLVLLPYARSHAEALIRYCLSQSGMGFVLRPHPVFPESIVRSWVSMPDEMVFDERPMADVLQSYSYCLHSGSTAALECLSVGMHTVKYLPERLDLDPLLDLIALPDVCDGDVLRFKDLETPSRDMVELLNGLVQPTQHTIFREWVIL